MNKLQEALTEGVIRTEVPSLFSVCVTRDTLGRERPSASVSYRNLILGEVYAEEVDDKILFGFESYGTCVDRTKLESFESALKVAVDSRNGVFN